MDQQFLNEALDLINRVRVTLGGLSISAKSASDVVMIDNALEALSNSMLKIKQDTEKSVAEPDKA
jgi:hypothetical protein